MSRVDPFERVLLTAEAKVGGENLVVKLFIDALTYDQDEDFKEHIHDQVRRSLMDQILKRWSPVVRVHR